MENYNIRSGTIQDLERISQIEAEVFPEAEAATKDKYEWRIKYIGDWFWVLESDGAIRSFIFGRQTELDYIDDELYEKSTMAKGDYVVIMTLATQTDYQCKGFGGALLDFIIDEAKRTNMAGLTLGCKEKRIDYYSKYGFESNGVSESDHGGAVWYDMKLLL
ncbi:MAG: GNAT family N-acetyltransferase [Clostridiales bacterium]|nr:MAG: GNAT family N-acetyltransferase [Clostridiales bacterium]